MGRFDNTQGDEDEIEAEFQTIKEERYQFQGDEENEDWYCNHFVEQNEMVIADR
jgi:hypothetical protein